MQRRVTEVTGTYTLREEREPYSANFTPESGVLRPENTLLWDETLRSLRHSVVRPAVRRHADRYVHRISSANTACLAAPV